MWRASAMFCWCAVPLCFSSWATAETSDSVFPYLREAHLATLEGKFSERSKIMAAAVESFDDPVARWKRGEVLIGGEWQTVRDSQLAAAEDRHLMSYEQLREQSGSTAAEHLTLARWCRQHGLADEARYHWLEVLASNPQHAEALRELGLRIVNGRTVTSAELSKQRENTAAWRENQRFWKTRIRQWQREVGSKDHATSDAALEALAQVDDPASIEFIEAWTLPEWTNSRTIAGHDDAAFAYVIALSSMSDSQATMSLARHALAATSDTVRESAATALRERSMYEYVPDLLNLLANPVESNWSIRATPTGDVFYTHVLFQDGANGDRQHEVRRGLAQIDGRAGSRVAFDPMNARIGRAADSFALVSRRMAARTESEVAQTNQQIAAANDRIVNLLRISTGEDYGSNASAWWDWWSEYTATERTSDDVVYRTENTSMQTTFYDSPYAPPTPPCECFVSGTPVWTKTGLRPIESLNRGDMVLAQDVTTGELAYRPIVSRTVRQPSPAMEIRVGSDTIVATIGHPFFKLGDGWTMAKQLAGGDVVAGVERPLVVDSTSHIGDIEAHNLIVEGFASYFVGQAGLLVHDGTPTPAVRQVEPGLLLDR